MRAKLYHSSFRSFRTTWVHEVPQFQMRFLIQNDVCMHHSSRQQALLPAKYTRDLFRKPNILLSCEMVKGKSVSPASKQTSKSKARRPKSKRRRKRPGNAAALSKEYEISSKLSALLGGVTSTSRHDAVRRIWAVARERNLNQGKSIVCDAQFHHVFGVYTIGMYELPKLLSDHFGNATSTAQSEEFKSDRSKREQNHSGDDDESDSVDSVLSSLLSDIDDADSLVEAIPDTRLPSCTCVTCPIHSSTLR